MMRGQQELDHAGLAPCATLKCLVFSFREMENTKGF